jgi:2-alkenal reductase
MNRILRRMSLVLLILMVGIGAFAVGTYTSSVRASTLAAAVAQQAEPSAQTTSPVYVTTNESLYNGIYNQVAQSVVSINVIARQAGYGYFSDQYASGTGTGFVIDTQGHIVTNYHVVEGANRIEVNFFDGRIVRGELVAGDRDSDIAVIRVSDVPADMLVPITFGDSNALFIGQEVVAIGSPFNQPWTMTTGIISALNRSIRGLNNYSIGSVIQTDAAINPGNSGGPLLNLQGQVIGVNSQIISRTSSNSGIGFAIPSNLVSRVVRQLIEDGTVDYSYLGISGGEINLYWIDALNLDNASRGVVVTSVEPRSAAASAGLQMPSNPVVVDGVQVPTQVDIITAINGTPMTSMESLISYLANNTSPGQTVTLSIMRNGTQTFEVPVTLGTRPSSN